MKSKFYIDYVVPPLILSLIIFYYQLHYAFSFIPITEGWFSVYANLIRHGSIPHRDFSLLLSPFYPLHIALFQSLFGEELWVLRAIGVVVTCGIGVSLWGILSKLFNTWISSFAALVGCIYYQSGTAFIGYDFTQFLTLYSLIGCWLLILDLQRTCEFRRHRFWKRASFYGGGVLCAAVLTKHSNGVAVWFFVTTAYVIATFQKCDRADFVNGVVSLAFGNACVLIPIITWIIFNGAMADFYQQVFSSALSAKGGLEKVIFGWLHGFFGGDTYPDSIRAMSIELAWLYLLTAGLSLCLLLVSLIRYGVDLESIEKVWRYKYIETVAKSSSLIATICIALVIFLIYNNKYTLTEALKDQAAVLFNRTILVSVHLYAIGLLLSFTSLLVAPRGKSYIYFLVFALGFGLTIGNGTSAGLSEISGFLGLSIIIAFLIHSALPSIVTVLVPIALSLLLTTFLVDRKFTMPYQWWTATSADVRTVNCEFNREILDNICVDSRKLKKIEELISQVTITTTASDELYVFPHMPLFNLISGRNPYKNVVVSWFDFMSIKQASDLIEALKMNPPKAMIIARLPELVFSTHERLFNHGSRSIQRDITDTLDMLIERGDFEKLYETEIDGVVIDYLIRR